MPVRYEAVLSLPSWLQKSEAGRALLEPYLETLVQSFLTMMANHDSDDILDSLRKLIDLYTNEIRPFAFELASGVLNNYQRLYRLRDEDEEGNATLTAVSCLDAVKTLLNHVDDQIVLIKLEGHLFPLIDLSPENAEFIEEMLGCVVHCFKS